MSPVFTVVSFGTLKELEGAMVRNVERCILSRTSAGELRF